jgi:hypothetical protein
MTKEAKMIRAYLQKSVPADYPVHIGHFDFIVLPRIGEIVHVNDGDNEIALKVVAIDHWGRGEADAPGDGLITLTCLEE